MPTEFRMDARSERLLRWKALNLPTRGRRSAMSDSRFTAMLFLVDRSVTAMIERDRTLTILRALARQHSPERRLRTLDIVSFNDRPRYEKSFENPSTTRISIHPRGGRAFRDCVAFALVEFALKIEELPEHARPSSVEVVIASGRADDSSVEISQNALVRLVQRVMLQGWAFACVGDGGVDLIADAEAGLRAGAMRNAS